MANLIKLAPDQILLREGEHSHSMFWVQNGQLMVTRSAEMKKFFWGTFTVGSWLVRFRFSITKQEVRQLRQFLSAI